MSQPAKIPQFWRKQEDNQAKERREILESIGSIKEDLRHAYSAFNTACAPELVEACVYDINALQARYSYLLRRMKECGGDGVGASVFKEQRTFYE